MSQYRLFPTISPVNFLTLFFGMAMVGLTMSAHAQQPKTDAKPCPQRFYVFSWSLSGECPPKPRGGTTKGAPVSLVQEPSSQWRALQKKGLSKYDRDRQAILAMSGAYRTSFEFIETIGYLPQYELASPYQSWGTEYVYVVEDRGDFISLQHIMVMVFMQDDGSFSQPIVMKHWRQDWQYESRKILEFTGNNSWQLRKLKKREVQGTWSQSVYHVDDSPRYASYGLWQHNPSFSVWESKPTWLPLPRREHSVRDDYHILEGINRQLVLPTGWVHEQSNQKRILSNGQSSDSRYVANELGNNRYQLIRDFDWQPGDEYWQSTSEFWGLVRERWKQLIEQHPHFTLKNTYQGVPMFMALFQMADQFAKGELKQPKRAVETLLNNFLET